MTIILLLIGVSVTGSLFSLVLKKNISYKVGSQKVSNKGTLKWVWGAVFWRVRT